VCVKRLPFVDLTPVHKVVDYSKVCVKHFLCVPYPQVLWERVRVYVGGSKLRQ
jgi:hypothetical protein